MSAAFKPSKRPAGHSNVYSDETESDDNGKAIIPMVGGARFETVKALPPLALSKEEWREIGQLMGWME